MGKSEIKQKFLEKITHDLYVSNTTDTFKIYIFFYLLLYSFKRADVMQFFVFSIVELHTLLNQSSVTDYFANVLFTKILPRLSLSCPCILILLIYFLI